MLQCMESLGKRNKYRDFDETYMLFERVFKNYLDEAEKDEIIRINEVDENYFFALEQIYSISKSIPCMEWNEEERYADSLVFYKEIGLVFLSEGHYYINSSKLKEKFIQFEEHNNKTNSYVKRV